MERTLDVSQNSLLDKAPTYMPAVLVNLFNNPNLGNTKEERLSKAIEVGLPFLAKVLEKHQKLLKLDVMDPNIPLNFNRAAGIAKEAPELLFCEFQIDQEGLVDLQ